MVADWRPVLVVGEIGLAGVEDLAAQGLGKREEFN